MRASAALLLSAAVVFLLPSSGCTGFPALEYELGATEAGREALARHVTNLAVASYYGGRSVETGGWLELALEIDPHLCPAHELRKRLHYETYCPRFLELGVVPALPLPREEPGTLARALLYPFWGLPFDLLELPLKAFACIPGLGIGTAALVMVPGVFLVWVGIATVDDAARHRRDDDLRSGPFLGDDEEDDDDGFLGGAQAVLTGLALAGGPVLVFLALNGLPACVYWDGWDDRIDGWSRCALWWTDWEPWRRRPERGVASAFFPNARRIHVPDARIPPLRASVLRVRERPLAGTDATIRAMNAAIDAARRQGPSSRAKVAEAIARARSRR